MNQPEYQEEQEEISLLDIVIVLIENRQLLIWGPIVMGLLALTLSFLLPKTYISQAILSLPTQPTTHTQTQTPAQAAALIASPSVQDPVIAALNLNKEKSVQAVRSEFTDTVKTTLGKDNLLRIDVTAESPEQAQAIGNATIDAWLKTTVPGESDRADLEKRLAHAQSGLAAVQRFLAHMAAENITDQIKPLTKGDSGISLVAVGELQSRYLSEVVSIPRALKGLSHDVVLQAPTLPTEPASNKKGLITLMATLAASVILLIFVFTRNAWRTMKHDPASATQLSRLSAALARPS